MKKNEDLERAIKNLEKTIESRKDRQKLQEAINLLKETKDAEEDSGNIPLSVSFGVSSGIASGNPLVGICGAAIGLAAETVARKNSFFAEILDGFLDFILEVNKDNRGSR